MISPPTRQTDRLSAILCAAALVLGTVLLLAAGPAAQSMYPSDDAAYLDACHRISLGQRLGRDFTAAVGPVAVLPTALAMRFFGADVTALVIGSVFVWLVSGALAWRVMRPRLPGWLAASFALFVAATAAAPYTLDFGSWRLQSYGMLYNRLAWATLCLAAGTVLLPRADGREPRGVAVGLGAGTIWLWLLKPNYLLILLPLVIYHWCGSPHRLAWLWRSGLGAAAMLAFVWVCVPFSPVGYVGTHLDMAREAPAGLMVYTLERSLRENLWLILGLLALWRVVLTTVRPAQVWLGRTVAAVIVCTVVSNTANCQFSEIPVWGALGWIAAGTALLGSPFRFRNLAVLAGVAIGLGFSWQPLASLAHNFAWKHYRAPGVPPAVQVKSLAWRDMPMRPNPGEPTTADEPIETAANYALWLNDGLALLAQVHPQKGAVLSLDWTNPFPFATLTPPARGDDIAWHVGRTMGRTWHPDATRLLAATSVVMEPRRSIQPESLAFKRSLFAHELAASFTLAGETPHWRAWVRRAPPSGG